MERYLPVQYYYAGQKDKISRQNKSPGFLLHLQTKQASINLPSLDFAKQI